MTLSLGLREGSLDILRTSRQDTILLVAVCSLISPGELAAALSAASTRRRSLQAHYGGRKQSTNPS